MRPIDADALIDKLNIGIKGLEAVLSRLKTDEPVGYFHRPSVIATIKIHEIIKEYIEKQPTVERAGGEWINVKEAVPDTDREVLVIVNGMAGKKVKFVNAIMIGLFDKAEGWILEDWPECESIEVSYWMEMPGLPDELKISDVNLKTEHRLVGGVFDDRG